MKKIVWVCNAPLPEIQSMVGIKCYTEGWLIGISDQLRKRKDIEFHYAFPQDRFKRTLKKRENGITFWGFYNCHKREYEIEESGVHFFTSMFNEIEPDIIHIFGTEYSHALECVYSIGKRKKIVVSLQGLVSELSKSYLRGISFFDRFIYAGLLAEKVEFYRRGINEKKILANVKNVIGRTDWDRMCVKRINPRCRYYHCNETLRGTFYEGTWDINRIERYSIFISQGNYPIKGLHVMISALSFVKTKYPKVMVYVAGNKGFIGDDTSYGRLIKKLIKKYHVEENIRFLGYLTDEKVKQRLLKTHVLLMPSVLENSPNSIGEAMMIGTPVVASNVGGIPSILKNGKEGYLYPDLDRRELSKSICKIFASDNLALRFSGNGKTRANILYSMSNNLDKLLDIYNEIGERCI